MLKRRRDPESDGTTSSSMEYNTVFIDTSLDTHIAMLLSDSDTVLDFKKKIMQEHARCFPKIGEMWIHSLKVKQRGNFYHLPDFMLVWSAFQGIKRNWFLSADASCYTNQQSSDHQTNDHSRGLSSDVIEIPALKMALPDGVIAEIIDSEMIDGLKVEKSSDKTTLETEFPGKKKQKIRCNEDLGHSPSLEKIQLHVAGTIIKEPGTGHLEVKVDNIYRLSEPKVKGKASSVNNDLSIIDGKNKETALPDIGITIKKPKLSAGLMYAMVASKDGNLKGEKRKTKKSQYPTGKVQDTLDLEHDAWKGEGVGPHTEICKFKKMNEVRGLSHLELEVDNSYRLSEPKVKDKASSVSNDLSVIAGKNKETDWPDIDVTINEPNLSAGLMNAVVASKDGNLDGKKKKKKKSQKPPGKIQETSDLEHEAWNGEGVGPHTEICNFETMDEVRGLSHLELKVDNIYQLSELKAKEKASSVNNDLSIIDGKNQEIDRPAIEVTIKEPKLSAGLMDAMVASKDGNLNGKKRKKKKSQKPPGKIQDTSDLEHEAWKGEGDGPHTEICKFETMDEVRGSSHLELNIDNIYRLSELKAEAKASSVNNDLSIIDGKNKEIDRPYIDVTIKEPKFSAGLMDAMGESKDGNLNGQKRKKKKSRKAAGKIQYTADLEHETWKGEGVEPHTEIRKSEKTDEVRGLSSNFDCGVMVPLYSKASEFSVPESKLKEAGSTSKFLDGDMVMEPEPLGGHRRNKRVHNSADTNLDKSDMEHINHGTGGSSAVLLCLPTNQVPEETDKGGSILVHKGTDVQMKLLDGSTADAEDKGKDAQMKLLDGSAAEAEEELTSTDGNKSGLVKFTQAMENVGVNEKKTNLAHEQALRSSENVLNKDKKTKKKTKRQSVASDVQENLPTRDQEVSFEEFATQENVSSYLNSVLDGTLVDSSQVVSHSREEKLEGFREIAADNDDLARSFQNRDEGINFKHYFVHGQKHDKAASGDKVQKAAKSSEVMYTGIKVKKHGLPSVSTSTELQSPLKSYESKDGKKQSLVMCATDRKDGDSVVNSNGNEATSNSTRKSLGGTGNGVRRSNLSETLGMSTLQKHNETPAASSFVKEKNLSLDKSSLGRSGSFPENRVDKRWLTELNVSNKTVNKTPQKSSLFMKVGTIFQDSSGESSGDDNGNAYSDSSTCSPSDSSSLSGCSKGESYLSQDSARNGSKNAKGRSNGGKNLSKLDLSSSNEMTMDMILRSSKRFKKAKLIASQNELEQSENQAMEFVPESQPTH